MPTTIPTTTTPPRQAPGAAGQRFVALDAGRLIAAIAVIYWHSVTDPTCRRFLGLASWSVPFFSAAAVFLLAGGLARNPLRPLPAYVRERLVRIGAPFVAWSAVYLLARNAEHWLVASKPVVPFEWPMLWIGTAHHLWFLPFIMAVCLLLFLPLRFMQTHRALIPIVGVLSLAAAAAIAILPGPPEHLDYLLMQAWVTAPAVLGAVALACAASRWGLAWATTIRWPLVGLALLALLLNTSPWSSRGTANLTGVLALLVCLGNWPSDFLLRFRPWGALAYGIYLVHILFVIVARLVLQRGLHLDTGPALSLLTFAISAPCSVAAAWLLVRSRWTKWLCP